MSGKTTNPLDLQPRWRHLWHRLGATGDPNPICNDLMTRYSEPGRAYHTLTHLAHCLEELNAVADPAVNRDAIEFALWFHDAIYDSTFKDSEARSAALAEQVAESAGLSRPFRDLVTELIMATCHATPPATLDESIMVDIDLAILGQSPARFDQYERRVRQEYAWVPAQAFAKGRAELLAAILARPRIYTSELFHQKYEGSARDNLTRSIAQLK